MEQKLKGALIRARWQQLTEGEKPTKYFLNLENRNYVSKHIRELKVNNKTVTNPKGMLDEMNFFYQNLYNKKDTVNIEDTNFANLGNQLPKLNEMDKLEIERDICLEDLKHTVFKSKNNKSPGPDGFSNEFYKVFWPQINILLLKLMNFYRLNGILNAAQTTGIITCIPKGGKARNDLKNWRPITLLNSIYKFYSGILAERIKKILPKLIHLDQKGFINGRFIEENTRITSDIINECNSQKINGLIILIDFEKAFDSISWNFILDILKKFNFGQNTINWVRSLQIDSTSKILQNGHLSETINLGRGCRQGDPISPYLFVLGAELLAEAIRSNTNIEGLTIHQKEHKLSQYADEPTLFLKYSEKNIRMETLREFEIISGLKVNTEKTNVVKIRDERDNRINLCTDLELIWTNKFTSLGITYDVQNMENITEQNINLKEKEIKKLINTWNGRNVTPLRKVILVKSLLISKITHILLSLPTPKDQTFKDLDNIFGNFIWGGKPPKLRKEILETSYKMGGLKMTNLKIFDQSLKISWLKRFKDHTDGWEEIPRKFNIHNIPIFSDKYPTLLRKNLNNQFWRDVVNACENLQNKINNIATKTYNIPLWNNSKINISFRKEWYKKGYLNLSDI